jgi:hypothetical protein
MEGQHAAGILRRRARNGEDFGLAHLPEFFRKIGLRLDQNAGPAGLFQMPGLRAVMWIVGADLDEKTARMITKEIADELPFPLIDGVRAHALLPTNSLDVLAAWATHTRSFPRKRESRNRIAEHRTRVVPRLRGDERVRSDANARAMRYWVLYARERRIMSVVEKPGTSSTSKT